MEDWSDYTIVQAKFYQNFAAVVRSIGPGWGNTIVNVEFGAAHKYDASTGWYNLADWGYDLDLLPDHPTMTQEAKDWAMNEWIIPSNRAAENTRKKINELANYIVTEETSLFTFDTGVAMIEIVTGKGDVRTMYRQMIRDAKDRGLDAMVASVNKAMGL
jgi:hypothetical protein